MGSDLGCVRSNLYGNVLDKACARYFRKVGNHVKCHDTISISHAVSGLESFYEDDNVISLTDGRFGRFSLRMSRPIFGFFFLVWFQHQTHKRVTLSLSLL